MMNRKELIEQPDCGGRRCPPRYAFSPMKCCVMCAKGRKSHRDFYKKGGLKSFSAEDKEFVRSKWDDEYGFWSAGSCSLPRRLRPTECLSWDCKDYSHFVCIEFNEQRGVWLPRSQIEIPRANVTKAFHKKYWKMLSNVKQ